jgi:murein DD-endopeptidase MepM/ murein hydrolase activator NlpD
MGDEPVPAAGSHVRPSHQRRLRLAAGAIAIAFLCSLGAATAAPAAATNWSRQIAATRASQIAWESSMRAADSEVKSLKRARKQAARKLTKAGRRLKASADRRSRAKRRLAATRTQLTWARVALAAASTPVPPPPDTATAILVLIEPPPVPATSAADAVDAVDAAATSETAGISLLGYVVSDTAEAASDADVTVEDVVALEQQQKKHKRAFQKARKSARRASANLRAKRNSLASLKARQRGAIARREGSEAALGSRILSMSRLAQRRVAKKTNVRPGINSGFAWPASGRISQTYGCTGFRLNPPRGSCRHFHDGLDITGYRGAPIRAAAVGVVSYVGWNPWDQNGRAFMVMVAHPGGYETLYGHLLATRRVRVGQLVHRGEVIGYMGNTGRSTGVHLHFELRRGRTTLNPLGYL